MRLILTCVLKSKPPDMQRASKLISGLRLPGETITADELVCAAWPNAVGKKVASYTRPRRMVRSRLVVEVEDAIWQRQLFGLTRQILRNLEKSLGPGVVDDLEFRVVPRRRGPERASQSVPSMPQDEAAGITDPVLRSIYLASRRKAQA